LREKAVGYLRRAGLKAAARSALQDAWAWLDQALEILASLPESQSTLETAFEIRLELRSVLLVLDEHRIALKRLREAEALAERLRDDRRLGQVRGFMINLHMWLGELDEALVVGGEALEIADRLGDLRLRIPATTYLHTVLAARGEYERVVELATDNLARLPADWLYERFGSIQPPAIFDRIWLTRSLGELGRFAEAAAYRAEMVRLAETTQSPQTPLTLSFTYYVACSFHLLKGDWTRARSMIERSVEVARAGNVIVFLRNAVASSAWILAQLGEMGGAIDRLREGEQLVAEARKRGYGGVGSVTAAPLGRACLLLGRLDEALHWGTRAVEACAHRPGGEAHAQHLLGDIASHPERFDPGTAEAHYRQARSLAEPRGMRPLIAHCHRGLGRLYQRMGNHEQAREHFTTAISSYREMGMLWLEEAETELRELG